MTVSSPRNMMVEWKRIGSLAGADSKQYDINTMKNSCPTFTPAPSFKLVPQQRFYTDITVAGIPIKNSLK